MRYVFAFDVESNGLHGEPFAVGCVVLDEQGRIADGFMGRCPIQGEINPYVIEHVLPALPEEAEMPTYPTLAHLCRAFWAFYLAVKKQFLDTEVWADVPFPVETRFLQRCVELEPERAFEAPFPLFDVATAMAMRGWDPMRDREDYVLDFAEESMAVRRKHDPMRDAYFSGLCMLRLKKLR